MTLVLIGKGLLLEGWVPSKVEVKKGHERSIVQVKMTTNSREMDGCR